MLDLVAKKLFLTKGVGVADDKLTSFEFALRNAGIAGTNIVLISSIFPPQAKLDRAPHICLGVFFFWNPCFALKGKVMSKMMFHVFFVSVIIHLSPFIIHHSSFIIHHS